MHVWERLGVITGLLWNDKDAFCVTADEVFNLGKALPQKGFDLRRSAVTQPNPYHLWWVAAEHAELLKIRVFAYDGQRLFLGALPEMRVVRLQAEILRMNACWIDIS